MDSDVEVGSSASSAGGRRVPGPREMRDSGDWQTFLNSYHKTYIKSNKFADPFTGADGADPAQAGRAGSASGNPSPTHSRSHSHSPSYSPSATRLGTARPSARGSRAHSPTSMAGGQGLDAGPSNQDPGIPDLMPGEFSRSDQDRAGRAARRSERSGRDGKSGKSKGKEPEPEQEQEGGAGAGAGARQTDGSKEGQKERHLTRANMEEHNEQEADYAAREKDADAQRLEESLEHGAGEDRDADAEGSTSGQEDTDDPERTGGQARRGTVVPSGSGGGAGTGGPSRRRKSMVHYAELAPVSKPEPISGSDSEEKGEDTPGPSESPGPEVDTARPPARPPVQTRASAASVPRAPRGPGRSRKGGSKTGSARGGTASVRPSLIDSATGESGSTASDTQDGTAHEWDRVREHFEEHGYMPAPRQSGSTVRRRLRIINRLGLDQPTPEQRAIFDRFTRLVTNVFKAQFSILSIVGKEKQTFVSKSGITIDEAPIDSAYCAHTILGTGRECMVVPNALADWRFRNNPFTGTEGEHFNFYAGAPLRIGSGARSVAIGSLCVMDRQAREFTEEDRSLLMDLAECVVSELELMHSQTARGESEQLHQISVDFLRRSLRNRPTQRPGESRRKRTTSTGDSSSGKRHSGADQSQDEAELDIYDEACREIRLALDAYAVAVVDLSQFHLFYPAYQNTTIGGSSSKGESSRISRGAPSAIQERSAAAHREKLAALSGAEGDSSDATGSVQRPRAPGGSTATGNTSSMESEDYSRSSGSKQARATYAVADPLMPGRTPQVLYIPSRRRSDPHRRKETNSTTELGGKGDSATPQGRSVTDGAAPAPDGAAEDTLDILGYSSDHDHFAFNFSTSPAGRKNISEFIALNVKTRRVWFARDDSEGIAMSINHLMPPGTETSLAMPVFDFDGQVTFAVVACWTDPLYTYPSGALQFVETIAGSLLAAVMKEKLHHAQRAQFNFAAAASHELRTPLHQINAAAQLLRTALHPALSDSPRMPTSRFSTPAATPELPHSSVMGQTWSREDKSDILAQLEIIEANGLALGSILENIIDTLDIGRASTRLEQRLANPYPRQGDSGTLSSFELPGTTAGFAPPTPKEEQGSSLSVRAAMERARQSIDESSVRLTNFADVLEKVVDDAMLLESKTRRAAGEIDGLSKVEVILEVLPRTRGGWAMSNDPGPLARALGKIIHNALKFTDRGYVHVTVQDVSREVNLPTGYDNSMSVSVVSIDIKDTGRGMTTQFLDKEILRPFSKADPFMPGSGLGLGLAQRMIEIIGGKLAIASTIGKGTLVHVELPMHLLSEDNDDDVEVIYNGSDGKGNSSAPGSGFADRPMVRSDGIYLSGWEAEKDLGLRRVGKSLLRQFKLHDCRIVSDISLASLVVVPETVKPAKIERLAAASRKGAEIVVLGHPPAGRDTNPLTSPTVEMRDTFASLSVSTDAPSEAPTKVTHVYLPLRPSVIRRIIRPTLTSTHRMEYFRSAVVGGDEATREREVTAGLRSPDSLERNRTLPTTSLGSLKMGSYTSGLTNSSLGIESPGLESVASASPFGIEESINPSRPSSPVPSTPTGITAGVETPAADTANKEVALPPAELDLPAQLEGQFAALMRPSLDEKASDPLPQTGGTFTGEEPAVPMSREMTPKRSNDLEEGRADKLQSLRRPRLKETISEPTAPRPAGMALEPLRVLVVEDNAVNRRILTTMLKRTACHYAEAVDGQDAINKFLSFAPDLILLDINMPIKDGYQAATEIRQIEKAQMKAAAKAARRATASAEAPPMIPEESLTESQATAGEGSSGQSGTAAPPLGRGKRCKIIAVTAMSNETDKRRGLLESGIDEWRTKPVGINQLTEDVQRLKVRGVAALA